MKKDAIYSLIKRARYRGLTLYTTDLPTLSESRIKRIITQGEIKEDALREAIESVKTGVFE